MCTSCGCGHPDMLPAVPLRPGGLVHDPGSGLGPVRRIVLEQDILAKNAEFAAVNRHRFAAAGVLALNLVSAPGAGKTTLLARTVTALRDECPLAVLSGDPYTAQDAERIAATGVPVLQINTGKGCHLDAQGVGRALDRLPLPEGGILFIENVGNLVCPVDFDLGEDGMVLVLSVTEGEDKPLKYAPIFAAASVLLLNKVDLLAHVDFDLVRCLNDVRRVHADLPVLQLSARSGAGFATWLNWLRQRCAALRR
ncbi:MAG TPA: hydrogenase nickel incorporation protein HypB [Candidatus Competibacteraceae bacterium]|nr:MAG: hydrogenase accessory protein HypB [Candidatus Competibacteraceae bacterium]HQC73080.1 hydrogenase nickel incorporation protein HypB [Candidatus Competibacteraceae bacterium]